MILHCFPFVLNSKQVTLETYYMVVILVLLPVFIIYFYCLLTEWCLDGVRRRTQDGRHGTLQYRTYCCNDQLVERRRIASLLCKSERVSAQWLGKIVCTWHHFLLMTSLSSNLLYFFYHKDIASYREDVCDQQRQFGYLCCFC